ncbi:MAG: gliding motility protein GldN, partial [Bacteroidota bacterium]
MKKIISVLTFVCLFAVVDSFAQIGPQGYNPNSVRPILEDDVMYRTTIWRRINLLEKQNKPFFSFDNEVTRVIIDAVREKKVQAYYPKSNPRDTGFEEPMEMDEFEKNLSYYNDVFQDSVIIRPSELYILEVKEDLIFDRRRSRMYWDIQSLTMVIPQGTSPESEMGDIPFATFKFKDLYEYFREAYNASQEKGSFADLRAFWYNPENPRRHVALGDAFELRLFSSRIFKVSNPDDKDILNIVTEEYGDDP